MALPALRQSSRDGLLGAQAARPQQGGAEPQLKILGARRVYEEVVSYGSKDNDDFGWAEADWADYLYNGPAVEHALPSGMPSDVLDRGNAGRRLQDFVALPQAHRRPNSMLRRCAWRAPTVAVQHIDREVACGEWVWRRVGTGEPRASPRAAACPAFLGTLRTC